MVLLATTVSLSAVSHDIWLLTNDRLVAECSLSNSDLAFYHEWPSIFNSGQDPKTPHIFSHQDTVHLTVTWIKAVMLSHHTDQRVNMQLLTQQGSEEKQRADEKQGLWLLSVHYCDSNMGIVYLKKKRMTGQLVLQACGSLEHHINGRILTTRSRQRCQRGELYTLRKGINHFTQL